MSRSLSSLSPLLAATLLVSCGGRSPAILADGATERSHPRSDAKIEWSHPLADGRRWDGCVRPPGGCFSSDDCAKGSVCEGCGSDPCCPICNVCYGKCVPIAPTTCKSNNECTPSSFCNLDGVCVVTGAKAGLCEARPGACNKNYAPVCGCDGKTYDNDCMAHAQGVSVKQTGDCSKTCQSLDQAYLSALTAAKTCCPTCKSIQCAKKIKIVGCGCETYVHELNTSALQILATLEAQVISLGCGAGLSCPPGTCTPVIGASCEGTGSVGTCKDNH